MMSPGVTLGLFIAFQRRLSTTERCITVGRAQNKKSSPFCSDMKRDSENNVSYWNINHDKTSGLRSRSDRYHTIQRQKIRITAILTLMAKKIGSFSTLTSPTNTETHLEILRQLSLLATTH
jgi:hypothetical protein